MRGQVLQKRKTVRARLPERTAAKKQETGKALGNRQMEPGMPREPETKPAPAATERRTRKTAENLKKMPKVTRKVMPMRKLGKVPAPAPVRVERPRNLAIPPAGIPQNPEIHLRAHLAIRRKILPVPWTAAIPAAAAIPTAASRGRPRPVRLLSAIWGYLVF